MLDTGLPGGGEKVGLDAHPPEQDESARPVESGPQRVRAREISADGLDTVGKDGSGRIAGQAARFRTGSVQVRQRARPMFPVAPVTRIIVVPPSLGDQVEGTP
ncbi:hypothetical protein GCM10009560_43980 [Nonomuraea longicatena]|uniref:Uncharacterized protein n=1 Tax=Nonomuraea longicatena TaxID=83682 RepID=A0ABP4AF34_9ACTN